MVVNKELVEYPLKVVEIAEFFLNFDDLVWQRITKNYSKTVPEKPTSNYYSKCCGKPAQSPENWANEEDSSHNDDILLVDGGTSRPVVSSKRANVHKPCLNLEYNGAAPPLTLLFIDSDLLRLNFEKSHLKLVNNIIVLDRHIKLANIQETYSLLNLTLKSNRWLLQGSINHTKCEATRKRLIKKGLLLGQHNDGSNMDVLLILNSSNDYVKNELINGFQKLIDSFTNETKATFEIDFESPLVSYFKKRMDLNTPNVNTNNNSKSLRLSNPSIPPGRSRSELITRPTKIKFLKSNIVFTTMDSFKSEAAPTRGENPPYDHLKQGPHKFGFLINRIKSAFSNKNPKLCDPSLDRQSYSKFSLDNLPYILCYLDENKSNMKYSAYNDEKFSNIVKSNSMNPTYIKRKGPKSSALEAASSYDNHGIPADSDSNLDEISTSSASSSSYSSSSPNASIISDDSSNSTSRSFTYIGQHELGSALEEIQKQKIRKDTINDIKVKDQPVYDVPYQNHKKKTTVEPSTKFVKNPSGTTVSRGCKINPARFKTSSDVNHYPAGSSTSKPLEKSEVGSISAMSSITNYLNRKKKLSQSFERLNFISTFSGQKKDGLIANEERRDDNGVGRVSNSIEFKESDFLPRLSPSKKKRDARIEINFAKEERDEPIQRHPALVKNSFRSRSMDILSIRDSKCLATKPILKPTNHSAVKTTDLHDVDEATKLNTYLNGQVNNHNNLYKRSSTENPMQRPSVVYLTPINLNESGSQPPQAPPPPPPPSHPPNPDQRLKKNTNSSGRQMSNSNLYSKCMNSKNPTASKRAGSPPPPIYLSPNGLLAPPPTVTQSRSYRPPQASTSKHQYLYPIDLNNHRPNYPAPVPYPAHPPKTAIPNKENLTDFNKKKFHELREIFENNNRTRRSEAPKVASQSPSTRSRADYHNSHHFQYQQIYQAPQPAFCPEFLPSDFTRANRLPMPGAVMTSSMRSLTGGVTGVQPPGLYNHLNHYHFRKNDSHYGLFLNK